jgi:23S rRNA (adenine2503-C2)-methyltransferase
MTDIRNYSLEDLAKILKGWQEPEYRARQVFSWIYQKGAGSFEEITNLSLALRKKLKENFTFRKLELAKFRESVDATKKFLFRLEDDNFIESVMIPAEGRFTACLSTQVGCKYSCKFCASGLLGFKRNLEVWEILSQALEINRRMRGGGEERVTHIVFMGTGEPLDNYDNVLEAIRIINAKDGLNIGARRITISTAGVIPGINKLSREGLQIELSVSLHASNDTTRSRLMPINKKYPLKDLIYACKEYASDSGRQVTFEYALIKDVNCSNRDGRDLVKLSRGWLAKVNLLVYNPVKELSFQPPDSKEISAFKHLIQNEGIPVTLRKPRGQDIEGACGQLRLRQGA